MSKKIDDSARIREIRKLKKQLLALLRPGECIYMETRPVRGELKRV